MRYKDRGTFLPANGATQRGRLVLGIVGTSDLTEQIKPKKKNIMLNQ